MGYGNDRDDAMTHAVEAIGRSTTKENRANAIEAVKLIFPNVYIAYDHGDDTEARRNMLIAACLAEIAFTKSYVGYVTQWHIRSEESTMCLADWPTQFCFHTCWRRL